MPLRFYNTDTNVTKYTKWWICFWFNVRYLCRHAYFTCIVLLMYKTSMYEMPSRIWLNDRGMTIRLYHYIHTSHVTPQIPRGVRYIRLRTHTQIYIMHIKTTQHTTTLAFLVHIQINTWRWIISSFIYRISVRHHRHHRAAIVFFCVCAFSCMCALVWMCLCFVLLICVIHLWFLCALGRKPV